MVNLISLKKEKETAAIQGRVWGEDASGTTGNPENIGSFFSDLEQERREAWSQRAQVER